MYLTFDGYSLFLYSYGSSHSARSYQNIAWLYVGSRVRDLSAREIGLHGRELRNNVGG